MAQTVITTDDLDGSPDANTYKLINPEDGRTYSIDLAPKNFEKLCKALAPFIEKATLAHAASATVAPAKKATGDKKRAALTDDPRYNKAAYVEWATAQGIPTGKRPKNEDVKRYLDSL